MSESLSARGWPLLESTLQVVKVFFWSKQSPALLKLQSLAGCFGIYAEAIDLAKDGDLQVASLKDISQTKCGIVLDVASLTKAYNKEALEELAASLSELGIVVLLLISNVDKSTAQFLKILTNNAIRGITPVEHADRVSFPADSGMLSGELASHSYPRKPDDAAGLLLSSEGKMQVIMTLGNSPTFVSGSLGKAHIFVWITDAVFDVFQPLQAEIEFEQSTHQYIPAIIFLRFAFGDQCWHNPSAGAGIVIDDPLLRKSYGFIKFPQLLESARRHKYHITLAFIPWNHWRSRTKHARVFLNYTDCFNICAHGCDHTDNEFRSTDYQGLLCRSFVARQRMERHQKRTGLASERLMVCPKEQYSLEAMCAFADSRQFVALTCTACIPRNLPTPQVRGADLLFPAQDSFYGFPVFKRHYWNGMGAFAMALFLGKPAILVEHHEFFRNGPAGAEEFARRLAELRPDLNWRPLEETVMRTHARRRISKNKEEVRFFTDTFYLEHELEQRTDYRLVRRLPKTTRVERVRVSGREVPFTRTDDFLTFETCAERPETLCVQIDITPVKPTKSYSRGVKYQASVAVRRGLSELRDNIISRNRIALKAGQRLMKFLKYTAS